ncbi:MAG TPA: aminopeptidase P family N-terminal domain-containing protein [Burkholderiales bacterium]|nr:aminopeptidase P family N-terminal domain-containing protein [Burkholderiales bacterium]
MRRGLISWSRDEVSPSVLERRVACLQEQMRAAGLGVVLIYTSFARPSAAAWLTHFVPYWNEALLVVFPTGAPVLLAAFSKRVHDWIRSVSHLGEVRSAPDLGRAAAAFLKERPPESPRIGVLELDALPWHVAEPIMKSEYGRAVVDATGLFASIRQPADEVEIRLGRRAAAIAVQAFKAIPRGAKRASELLSALDGSARLAGAEEVLPRLAPDLRADATLRRLEGDALLGERYAVELSVAYKATWVRITRCVSTQAVPPSWRGAADRFVETVERLNEANLSLAPQVAGSVRPGKTVAWTLETCRGSPPLSIVATGEAPSPSALPGGSLACLSMRLNLDDGPWLGGEPLILGSRGHPSRLLI